jgi:putative transposase
MIDADHRLPLVGRRNCWSSRAHRSTTCRGPTSAPDLALMRRIDVLHLEHPFTGSRMMRDFLKAEGHFIGRKHVSKHSRARDANR